MNTTYTDYLELPAPFAVAQAALCDLATWVALPTGAERLGDMWRWGAELYTVHCDNDTGQSSVASAQASASQHTLRWQITPLAVPGPDLTITLTLYDAVICTHAAICITLNEPGFTWPWRRARYTRHLATIVRACSTTLHELLTERSIAPVALEAVATTIAAPVAVSATAERGRAKVFGTQPGEDFPHHHTPTHQHARPTFADTLRERYPQTVTYFEEMQALDHLERICQLEQGWQRTLRGEYDASIYSTGSLSATTAELDYDLIYVGGGLGLLHAAVMAQRYGWRVLLFDRGQAGCTHREWNISRDELQALVTLGVVSWDELADVVMREYHNGVVRFYDSPHSRMPASELWLPSVLNIALDAGALLRLMRRKLEAAGGTVLDHYALRHVRVCSAGSLRIEVELESLLKQIDGSTTHATYSARLLLDGMGSTSPLALLRHAGRPFASVCPTVGTVARGFIQGSGPREHDPTIGDILISVADTQNKRQLIWEGFPGRDDELTVYVFYYATLNDKRRPINDQETFSLLELFEQYFTLLTGYKQPGPRFRHVKPVYGYIPGRHSVRSQEAPLLRGVVPIGDSAAQQSPLTFCGFGSHVRNLNRTTSLLDYALRHDLLDPQHLGHIRAFQTNVSLNWVFSRFMHPWSGPHNVNELHNVFLGALNKLGPALSTRFYQDRMRWIDFCRIINRVMWDYPGILVSAGRVLGPEGFSRWARDLLHFSAIATYAALGQAIGSQGERALYRLYDRMSPALGLRVRSTYAEWRSMGWI